MSARNARIHGNPLLCLVCGGNEFVQRKIKMNTTGASLFDLDWLNKSAVGAICSKCGFVHQFAGDSLEWI